MIDRRNFTIGAAMVAVAPPLQLLSCQQPTAAASPTRVAFKIHGWNTANENSVAEEVWLRLDRSWRAAWR